MRTPNRTRLFATALILLSSSTWAQGGNSPTYKADVPDRLVSLQYRPYPSRPMTSSRGTANWAFARASTSSTAKFSSSATARYPAQSWAST